MHHYKCTALYKDMVFSREVDSEPVLWLLAAPDPGKRDRLAW